MTEKLNPHEIEWTEEKVANFWSYLSSNKAYSDEYFSSKKGESLISFVGKYTDFEGRILDFGCAKGFLIGHLLKKGIECEGVDFSEGSIAYVNNRFKDNPLFKGAKKTSGFPLPFEDESIDIIFFIETIEHLLPHQLSGTLSEINRILRKGGIVIATTPNNENLEESKVMCPECGSIFHKVQHISSFTPKGLASLMEEHGFNILISHPAYFPPRLPVPVPFWTWKLLYRALGRELPRIICIASKK